MQEFHRTARGFSRVRRALVPAMAIAAIALTAQSAVAFASVEQPKPELKVEAERSSQGARLTFKGKNWTPNARIKITATRAPGAADPQDFGMFDADEKGELSARKAVGCSTNRMEDAQNESVTFTAADSATGVKVVVPRVAGGAWVCM